MELNHLEIDHRNRLHRELDSILEQIEEYYDADENREDVVCESRRKLGGCGEPHRGACNYRRG